MYFRTVAFYRSISHLVILIIMITYYIPIDISTAYNYTCVLIIIITIPRERILFVIIKKKATRDKEQSYIFNCKIERFKQTKKKRCILKRVAGIIVSYNELRRIYYIFERGSENYSAKVRYYLKKKTIPDTEKKKRVS